MDVKSFIKIKFEIRHRNRFTFMDRTRESRRDAPEDRPLALIPLEDQRRLAALIQGLDNFLFGTVEIEKVAEQKLIEFLETDLPDQPAGAPVLEPARIDFSLTDMFVIGLAQDDDMFQKPVDVRRDVVADGRVGL